VLARLFEDDFLLDAHVVYPKANEELEAGSLQSVDVLEATLSPQRFHRTTKALWLTLQRSVTWTMW
jgi:hypothetical protein